MRKVTFLIAGTLLTTLSAAASDNSSQLDGQIIVSAYDFAHIGSKTLTQTEQLATRIFALAKVDAQWTSGSLADVRTLMNDFSATPSGRCAAPLPAVLKVQIFSLAPNGFPLQGLGYSLPCAGQGVQVTIFSDRVEAVSRTTLTSFYRVLAYALAHELGHVLLRSSVHEQSGLMKGIWTKADWQRAAVTVIAFAPQDASFIAGELRVIKARDTEQRPHDTALLQIGTLISKASVNGLARLLKFCKFRPGALEDWYAGVGIFPKTKKIAIS